MKPKRKWCVALYAALLPTLASMQAGAQNNPADVNASVPVVNYQSVFSDYRPFQEQKGNPWQKVNKEVADNPGMGSMGSMKAPAGTSMPGMSHPKDAVKPTDGPSKGEKK